MGAIGLGLWLFYAVLGVRAVTRPNERAILVSALIFGVSYYWLSVSTWPTTTGLVLGKIWDATSATSFSLNSLSSDRQRLSFFMRIGHDAFSLFFALLGGALGAYWSRSQTK